MAYVGDGLTNQGITNLIYSSHYISFLHKCLCGNMHFKISKTNLTWKRMQLPSVSDRCIKYISLQCFVCLHSQITNLRNNAEKCTFCWIFNGHDINFIKHEVLERTWETYLPVNASIYTAWLTGNRN
jgi:hypothetical protein